MYYVVCACCVCVCRLVYGIVVYSIDTHTRIYSELVCVCVRGRRRKSGGSRYKDRGEVWEVEWGWGGLGGRREGRGRRGGLGPFIENYVVQQWTVIVRTRCPHHTHQHLAVWVRRHITSTAAAARKRKEKKKKRAEQRPGASYTYTHADTRERKEEKKLSNEIFFFF